MRIDKTLLCGAAMMAVMFTNTASDAASLLGRRQASIEAHSHLDHHVVGHRTDEHLRKQTLHREALLDLALIIWDEARGEGEAGMEAIGHVVLNRVVAGIWGSNVGQVLRAPGQFSAFRNASRKRLFDQIRANHAAGKPTPAKFDDAVRIADRLLLAHARGTRQDPMRAATHFHHKSLSPDWTARMRFVAIKGQHKFWRQPVLIASR